MLGALSDRFGRRPVILLSNFGLGLDYFVMALAPTLGWLLAGRIVSGITAASHSTATAYIADVMPPEKRARGFGMLGAAFGVGFVLGPAVGGVLGDVDARLPFWVAGGLSLANAMYGLFVLPESLPRERRARFAWRRANPIGSVALLRSHRELLGLAAVIFLFYLAHDVLPSTFVLYTSHRYGWDGRTLGLVLAGMGTCGMIVSAGLVQPIVGRFGERRALLGALLCGTAGFAVYGLAPTGAPALLGVPLQALWTITGPAAQVLTTRRVHASEQGRLQGANSSLRGIAGLVGPAVFTQTFAAAIDPRRAWQLAGAPFLLAGLLLATAAGVAWHVTRTR